MWVREPSAPPLACCMRDDRGCSARRACARNSPACVRAPRLPACPAAGANTVLILYNVVMLWIISGRGGFSQHPLDMSWNIIQLSCEVSCAPQSPIVRLRWLQRELVADRGQETLPALPMV